MISSNKEENGDVYQRISNDDAWKYPERRIKNEDVHLVKSEDGKQKETEFKFQFDSDSAYARQVVIKCYTGSCARHYHLDCLEKSKHRCLFNTLKKDEFKCSLHFCSLCRQTSEHSLLMQ
jgi:hypothetical protein